MKACRHGRKLCVWCLVQSIAFPIEHTIWQKVWPLMLVTKALGL